MPTALYATVVLSDPILCYECSTPFAMAEELKVNLLRNHRSFYCPNGHSQAYVGETEEAKAKKELKRTQDLLKWERDRAASLSAERDQVKASLRTTKGHVTRLRQRAVAGECPYGCGRRFAGLVEHIAKVHPDQHLEGE